MAESLDRNRRARAANHRKSTRSEIGVGLVLAEDCIRAEDVHEAK